jgi:ParB/Sulfiredoxin domain
MSTTVNTVALAILSIRDGGAQMRVESIRPETVDEYATEMLDGAKFPPVIVFYDGSDYWLADGFHRLAAATKINLEVIDACVREGTARDAILFGVGANASHGLRRSHADKRRAVERVLIDPEWARWSDRKIAEATRVDHKTVAKIRRELSGEFSAAPAAVGGEIPRPNGKPNGGTSLLQDVLRSVDNAALIAECHRRGLTVTADA